MEDGLIHIFFHGGTVCSEAVQLNPDDPFAFGPQRWLLFENPPLHLDTFIVPDAADWDSDGKLDLIMGSEAGNVWFLRNLDAGGLPGKWAAPRPLTADGKDLRQFLYRHENLQGPEELLIGYSNPTVEDWDLDGDLDIVAGCHGETYYLFENTGKTTEPRLTFRGPLRHGVGEGTPVSCAWRTRPGVGDVTGDGLPDLIGVDGKRMLTLWRRYRDKNGKLRLAPPEYPVDDTGEPFVNCRESRGMGRSKLSAVDWDRDGKLDVISSPNLSTSREFMFFYRNMGMRQGKMVMEFQPERIRVIGLIPKAPHALPDARAGRFRHGRPLGRNHGNGQGLPLLLAGTGDEPVDSRAIPRAKEMAESSMNRPMMKHSSGSSPPSFASPRRLRAAKRQ